MTAGKDRPFLNNTIMKLFEHMEDFDNEELSDFERREQLREAVDDYNGSYETDHDPYMAVVQYESWKRDKNRLD